MKLLRSILFLILICTFMACSHSHRLSRATSSIEVKDLGEHPYFGTSKVHRYELSNGLKVLIMEDHSAPVFAYQTWFNVGSRDEDVGLTGLAHLFEHMMFKATKNLPDGEFDRLLESAGAEGQNAFTSHDFTGYVQSLPSTKLELIASLEAERMTNLIIDEAVLDKEREVVQNERRFRNDNSPDGQIIEKMYELAFTKHSYRWPVIGYPEDLRRAKKQQCLDFYKKFYAPNNAVVVITGDVKPSKAVEVIKKHYGSIPPSKLDQRNPPKEPAQTAERIATKEVKSAVEKVAIAYHIPDVNHPDYPALQVLRNVLGAGKSSRLYRKLVDAGIATNLGSESNEQKDPTLFLLFVNLQKGRTSKEVLPVLDKEFKEIAAGKVSQEEIDRAVSLYRFSIFDDQASQHSKAQFIGFYETVAGNFQHGITVVNDLTKVTPLDLAKLIKKYFQKQNRSIVFGTRKAS